MKKVVTFGCVAASLVCLSLGATAQITKGKTRPLTTKQLMGALVKPHCGGIGEALKEAPKDDEGWATLTCRAALLNEASYILMDDGRCPDKVWADAAKALREGSAAVIEKAAAKDAAGAKTAFEAMTKSCAECHKAHKK